MKSFDDGLELGEIFLDLSKAFDKVWHEGFLLKLSLNGISGNLLTLWHNFLYCHKQRVVLNGQNSSWKNVNEEVPQGSILGLLLFANVLTMIRLFFQLLTTSNQGQLPYAMI